MGIDGAPPSVPATRAAAVADELRRRIQTGVLAPGTRLRQAEIAAWFGVSTTPVREAFTVLAKQGLVRHDVHRGVTVYPPTVDDVRENFEIRLALEPLATELAAERAEEHDLKVLDEQVEQLGRAVEGFATGDDLAAYERLDRVFHLRIFAIAHRPRLLEMIESLRDAAVAYAHLHRPSGVDRELLLALQEQHRLLAERLRRGDAPGARRVATDHVWLTGQGASPADPS